MCKNTKFEDAPDYEALRTILNGIKSEHCQPYKDSYEWQSKKSHKGGSMSVTRTGFKPKAQKRSDSIATGERTMKEVSLADIRNQS